MELVRSVDSGGTTGIVFHPRLAERLEYEIEVIDDCGIPELKRAKKLSVRVEDGGNTLDFKEKKRSDPALFVIPLRDIRTTTTVTVQTKQMMIKRDNLLVQVEFTNQNDPTPAQSEDTQTTGTNFIRFDLNKEDIPILLDQISQFKDEKINPSIVRAVAVAKDPKLCIQCAKKYALEYRHDYNLCLDCFTNNYGKVILEAPKAEYHGGHKAYLGGGSFDKFEYDRLILSEHYLIFAREYKERTKRW